MNPIWRLIFDFSKQGGDDDDGTRDQYDEYGGPVADVREGEIQTALIHIRVSTSGIRRRAFPCRSAGIGTTTQ